MFITNINRKEKLTNYLFFVRRNVILYILITIPYLVFADNYEKKTYATSSVGNYVWIDRNADGLQTNGENGAANITVLLLDGAGQTIETTTTDINGRYIFADINTEPSGKTFRVHFILPLNFRFSPITGSMQVPNNSDADAATGKTALFTLMPGEINNDIDAGVLTPANGTLPLHRLELMANLNNTTVKLNWFAENEMNTHKFYIEQSFNGINFTEIGSTPVAGQTNTPTEYHFTDNIQPLLAYSIIYYRIKAEDNDYRYGYSNIIPIRLNKITGMDVWPVPFNNNIMITYLGMGNSTVLLQLSDNNGRLVRKRTFEISKGVNQLQLSDVGILPPGIYFITITDNKTGHSIVEKITK